jgi:hypothetical protein
LKEEEEGIQGVLEIIDTFYLVLSKILGTDSKHLEIKETKSERESNSLTT